MGWGVSENLLFIQLLRKILSVMANHVNSARPLTNILIWVCTVCICHLVENFGVLNFRAFTLIPLFTYLHCRNVKNGSWGRERGRGECECVLGDGGGVGCGYLLIMLCHYMETQPQHCMYLLRITLYVILISIGISHLLYLKRPVCAYSIDPDQTGTNSLYVQVAELLKHPTTDHKISRSGQRVKLANCKSALNTSSSPPPPPVVSFTDRSKAVVPVLVLLFVALWFILRGNLCYVLPYVI